MTETILRNVRRNSAVRSGLLTLGLALLATVLVLLVLGSTAEVQGRVLQQGTATVYVDPADQTVSRCDTFTVAVSISDLPDDLYSYQFTMGFDPDVVTVTNAVDQRFVDGGFLSDLEIGEDSVFFFAVANLPEGETGTDEDGPLAMIELEAVGLGPTDLVLSNVVLGDKDARPISYTVQPGSVEATKEASQFAFQAVPSPQVAGEPFDVTITALNDEGSPAVNFSGLVQVDDTTGTLAPTQVTFDGPAVTATMTITRAEQDVVITAQAQNACDVTISGESEPFDVGPNVLADLTLQADPAELPVGETAVLTATLVDAHDNPVADGTEVVFETDLGEVSSQVVTKTTTAGVVTATLNSQEIGTATVTATADAVTRTVTVTFTSDLAVNVMLAADPTELTVGETAVLTATITDADAQPVPDGTAVVFETDLGELGSQVVTRTTTAGVATATLTSQEVGTATVSATAGAATDEVAVVFNSGPAATLTLVADPTQLTVGEASDLTATVEDQYGNPVADGTAVVFETDLGELGNQVVTRTTTAGVATATLSSQEVGTATVSATAGAATDEVAVVFNSGPAATLTLVADPTELTVGEASDLTATVVDQYGNPVADGTEVTFATDLGELSSLTATTTDAVAMVTLSSEKAGTATGSATAGAATDEVAVVFNSGPAATLTLVADPTELTVGKLSHLAATLEDEYGNLVADGTEVTFATDLGELSSLIATTTDGVAMSTLTSQDAGTATVTAAAGDASDSAEVVFNAYTIYMPIIAKNDAP